MAGNPNFETLLLNGACTTNARLDPLSSQTFPNHYSMFTGRPVSDHGYHEDADNGGYLPAGPNADVFDLVHDAGGTTAFYGSKEKFAIFDRSWNIDEYHYEKRSFRLLPLFLERMAEKQFTFAFLHIRAPDRGGHGDVGAESDSYRDAVAEADGYLGQVMDLAASLEGDTGIILTADHGFASFGNHADETDLENYRIPFCVLGPGVKRGADLYEINAANGYVDPGNRRAHDSDDAIRNIYAGILASDWLGLMPEYGPLSRQYLAVSDEEQAEAEPKEDTRDNVDDALRGGGGLGQKEEETEEKGIDSEAPIVGNESSLQVPSVNATSKPPSEAAFDKSLSDDQPSNSITSTKSTSSLRTALRATAAVLIAVGVGASAYEYLVWSGRIGKKRPGKEANKIFDKEDTTSISSGEDTPPSAGHDNLCSNASPTHSQDIESSVEVNTISPKCASAVRTSLVPTHSQDIEPSVEVYTTSPKCAIAVRTSLVPTETCDAIEVLNYNIHQVRDDQGG
eukprot:CAMPEP_0178552590 /NCGR_PEP_ID=MMETSP0697-20121206/7376_1 /TAXON_ID=265572 /ORGANISM="Extubocellulus spinifer, Strain CCMP396" /LENGTH=509 /DNA_ID=CAMNT_0020185473 /DNA_START=548 /DNA_END=2074 /DNA_ORIENTATION=-